MKTRICAIPVGLVVLFLVISQASVADNVRDGSTIVYQESGRVRLPMVNGNMSRGGQGIHGPILFSRDKHNQPWQTDIWSERIDDANMLAGAQFNPIVNEFAMVNSEFGLIDRPTNGIDLVEDNALASDILRQRPWGDSDPQAAANWRLDK